MHAIHVHCLIKRYRVCPLAYCTTCPPFLDALPRLRLGRLGDVVSWVLNLLKDIITLIASKPTSSTKFLREMVAIGHTLFLLRRIAGDWPAQSLRVCGDEMLVELLVHDVASGPCIPKRGLHCPARGWIAWKHHTIHVCHLSVVALQPEVALIIEKARHGWLC